MTAGLLEDKFRLETQLHGAPSDLRLLREYLTALIKLSRGAFGVFYASLPGVRCPLAIRANTSDVLNFR
jgi:hypothetical protein